MHKFTIAYDRIYDLMKDGQAINVNVDEHLWVDVFVHDGDTHFDEELDTSSIFISKGDFIRLMRNGSCTGYDLVINISE